MQNHGREAVADEHSSQRDPKTAGELDEGVTRGSLEAFRHVAGDRLSDGGDGPAWRGSYRKRRLTGRKDRRSTTAVGTRTALRARMIIAVGGSVIMVAGI
jgi:hypothetical protein